MKLYGNEPPFALVLILFVTQFYALTLWALHLHILAVITYIISIILILGFEAPPPSPDWPNCIGDYYECDQTGFCPDAEACEIAEQNEREDELAEDDEDESNRTGGVVF